MYNSSIEYVFFSVSFYAQYDTLHYDDLDRTYLLHVPSSYDGASSAPLVVALHPFGNSGSGFESTTGFSDKADENNFIVVYPNGTGDTRSWNGGNCCGFAMEDTIDDVGFISALIDTISANYNIDSTRIFATGFSNGSIIAYRLAAELSDKIAAIATGSGQMMLDECDPIRAVPIMHLHAPDDGVVPYEGGSIFPPVESIIDVWVEINGCKTDPDTIVNSGSLMVRKWAAQSSNADIVLFTTPTGGHPWLSSIPATDSVWAFFEAHPLDPSTVVPENLAVPTGLVLKQIYPNPFNAKTTIYFSLSRPERVTLKVFDQLGSEVAVLLSEEMGTGEHKFDFDSKNLPTGVYFFRIKAGTFLDSKKLVLLK
jgi:polyhydroxybutyrate depolymerase